MQFTASVEKQVTTIQTDLKIMIQKIRSRWNFNDPHREQA